MKRYGSYLALVLILAATVYAVTLRLGVHRFGRSVPVLDRDGGSALDEPLRLQTLGDRERAGELSMIRGRRIYEIFRAQIPAVPLLSTQASRLNVHPDRTYIITGSRRVFQRVSSTLEDTRVYESRGIAYDGIRYPGAFVLETRRPPEQLSREPVGPLPPLTTARPYLLLETERAVDLFFNGPPPDRPVNLILPERHAMVPSRDHHEFLRVLSSLYVLGQNAVRSSPGEPVDGGRLHLISGDPPGPLHWFTGRVEPPSRWWYRGGLVLAGLGVLGLGLLRDRRPLRWGFWVVLLVGAGFAGPLAQPLQAGVLAGGLLRLGLRSEPAVPWLVLAGLVLFGYSFQGYRLDPTVGAFYLPVGLAGACTLLLPRSLALLDWRPSLGHLLILLGGVGLLGALGTARPGGHPGPTGWGLLGGLLGYPLLPRASARFAPTRDWGWFVALAGWGLLFSRPLGWILPVVFGGGCLAWYLVEKTAVSN